MSRQGRKEISYNEPITDEQFQEMIKDENHDISLSKVKFTGNLIGQLRRYYRGEPLSDEAARIQ